MNKKIDNWKISYNKKNVLALELAQDILGNKTYKPVKEYKNDKRSYIAVIEFKGSKFILKFPKNEVKIPQRKIMTLLKKGEALNTYERTNKYQEKGLDNLCDIYAVGVKRRYGMISDSFMIMEYIDGEETQPDKKEDIKLLMEGLKKLHSYGLKHGDANPRNFIIEKNTGNLKIIDTQLKKDVFKIGSNYDYVNLFYSEVRQALKYVDTRTAAFKIAMTLKKIKRLKVISYIKKIKKKLRDKGWRI